MKHFKLMHSLLSIFLLILIAGLIQNVSASDYCTYYDFYVYDRETDVPIDDAMVTVTYKTINWGPNEIREWSEDIVSDQTNSSGRATVFCMDCGCEGLFDIESGMYFGPYGYLNDIIYSVKCESSNYTTIALISGISFEDIYWDGYIQAGSNRETGLVFYLDPENAESSISSGSCERFTTSSDIITDNVTGLQWRVGPDSNTDWNTAWEWIDGLGDNWRIEYLLE